MGALANSVVDGSFNFIDSLFRMSFFFFFHCFAELSHGFLHFSRFSAPSNPSATFLFFALKRSDLLRFFRSHSAKKKRNSSASQECVCPAVFCCVTVACEQCSTGSH